MTGTLRVAVVLFAVLFGMTLVSCGGVGGGNGGGGNESGNGGGGGNGAGGNGDNGGGVREGGSMSDMKGTWVGNISEGEDYLTIMFYFGRDEEETSGYGTIAAIGEEYPLYLPNLTVEPESSGVFTVTEELGEEAAVPPLFYYTKPVDEDTMKFWLSDEDEGAAIDLARIQTDLPEQMGLAAVQAVYNRDWMWFSNRVSDDVEDYLENYEVEPNESFDELTQQADLHFEDDLEYEAEEDKPRVGVGVMLDEESVVVRDSPSNSEATIVEFDYTTSTGSGGEVFMRLIRAGTASSGYTTRIDNFDMDYITEDGRDARDVTF